MRVLAIALCAALLGACHSAPTVPRTVTVVVEKFRPLPAWATDPLLKPEQVDGTVEARVVSEKARGVIIDLANCHRRLLLRLDRGEQVDATECAP